MAEASAVAPISASTAPAVTPPKANKTTEISGQPGNGNPEKSVRSESSFKGTKHTVNIDGAVDEVDYDELVKGYQREKASQKRFKEAQSIKEATSELLQGLSKGDDKAWAWFKTQVPKDVFKKVAFDFAYQEMEYDSLPDDEKRKRELDKREETLKEREEREKQEASQKQWHSEVQTAGQHIQKTIDQFVEKSGQQPSSEHLYRMSEYMLAYLNKNQELPPIEKLFQYTEKQLELDAQGVIKKKASNVQELLKWLPADVVKAIKKSFIEESEGTQPRRASSGDTDVPRGGKRGEPKKVGIDEAFTILEKRMKQRR